MVNIASTEAQDKASFQGVHGAIVLMCYAWILHFQLLSKKLTNKHGIYSI